MHQQFSISLVCGLLQWLNPESSMCNLLTLDTLYFLTSLWKTEDFVIIGSCYKKVGFGCGVAEDQNLKGDRSQCLGKHEVNNKLSFTLANLLIYIIDFGLLRDKAPQNSFNSTSHNSEILVIRPFSPKTGSFYDLTSSTQMHSVTLSLVIWMLRCWHTFSLYGSFCALSISSSQQ